MTFQESKESLFYKILWGAFVPVFSIFFSLLFLAARRPQRESSFGFAFFGFLAGLFLSGFRVG